jgi:ADP-heptose:LPS heptosyltransferase
LSAFGIRKIFSLAEIATMYGFTGIQPLENRFASLLDKSKFNIILHPKSQGNGREWGLENFTQLVRLLDKSKYKIFVSGVEKERKALQPFFDAVGNEVTDICGVMSLAQFISFISSCDGLVASGTGPVHLAAALGKNVFGLYPPDRPIHAGRWGPIGIKAQFFVSDNNNSQSEQSDSMNLSPEIIKDAIEQAATSA